MDLKDTTAVTNNLLHSLFIQCTFTFNGEKSRNRTRIIVIAPILRLS